MIFLGEQVSLLQLIGAGLVLAGVAMISLNKTAPKPPDTPPTR